MPGVLGLQWNVLLVLLLFELCLFDYKGLDFTN